MRIGLYALLSFCLSLCAILSGCPATEGGAASEHDAGAAMATALVTTIYRPDGAGGITSEEKRLPWERDMGNYVLSFVLEETDAAYDCRVQDGLAHVDIAHFPVFDDAQNERAAIASIVKTLTALPGVELVLLTFDGETLVALKNGTPVGEPLSASALDAPASEASPAA